MKKVVFALLLLLNICYGQPAFVSGIVNRYAAVNAIDVCNNTFTVDDAASFNTGDTVVIMQMKGASTDSANTINFGGITGYNSAGLYEFNYIKNKTGNTIELLNTLLNTYDAVLGSVQIIRVPYYQTATITDTLTCLPWDGSKGGVIILNSNTEINLLAPIDAGKKGFRGGAVGNGFSCGNISSWAAPAGFGGTKGEGIVNYFPGFEAGGARLANGGGGAYAANSGGGGGGNFGAGGTGGFHSNTCPSPTQSINGISLDYDLTARVYMGGAGGGGQQDNNQPVANGGNAGGIIILKAATLNGNNQKIITNGETPGTLVRDEGGAGGGAGGSVLLFVNGYAGNVSIEAQGGDGTSNENQIYPLRCHGPGGGGGGGFIGASVTVLPAFVSTFLTGGNAGLVLNPSSACFNTTNGATNGFDGGSSFNLVMPEATIPFKKNIDSVRILSSLTTCKTFALNGLGFTNTSPIVNWQWSFGDGTVDAVQNTSHTYAGYGSNTIKLVATDINGCKDSTFKTVTAGGLNFDFVFEQDACNLQSVLFRAVGDTTAEIFWSLGDGTIINNIRNPVHVFAGTGNYLVQYSTGNTTTGCIDTIRKTIYIGWLSGNTILTPDTTICFGTSKLLRSNIDSTLQFCWSPNSFLNNANFANPTTSTTSSTIYSLIAATEENNLVTNGDFTNGDISFTSDYNAATAPLANEEYFVAASSVNAGPSTGNCTDHTTATGNMLIARNDFGATAQVWGQGVTVLPNTNYSFTAWVQSVESPNSTVLQLSINGNAVADDIAMPATGCTWAKHAVLWNSGNNTTANLAVMHKPFLPGTGGYFAIDDISFAAYVIKKDTVKISVDTPFVDTRTDTSICESVALNLNTIGSNSYSWSPSTGLSDPSIASPMATPTNTTKYIVTGTSAFGCEAKDSVTISIKPTPIIASTGDTTICSNTTVRLFATGGIGYSWEPASLLNNPNIASPVTNPANANIKYVVAVTGTNNCTTLDSFTVSVSEPPAFTISPDKSACINTPTQLDAAGGNYYLWSPAALVSNPNIANPLAIATTTTAYSVLIRDSICGADTTLATVVAVQPLPSVTATKENDINCAVGSTSLLASGALQYNWAPATGLNDVNSASPTASPINTITYTVTGTDSNGCSNTATVTVFTDYSARVRYLVPNAFTPDGNGTNDCFRLTYFGLVQELEFTVFNRYGQKVFSTANPNACWDGTFKGGACNPGNYVYYIKAKTACGTVERKGNVMLIR